MNVVVLCVLASLLVAKGDARAWTDDYWPEVSRRRNRLRGANGVVGAYAAEPNQWHKAHVLVCDDRLWLDLDAKQVMKARDSRIGPGRVGFATGRESSSVRIRSLRLRDLGRASAEAEMKKRMKKRS